jgi:hypothetical protein
MPILRLAYVSQTVLTQTWVAIADECCEASVAMRNLCRCNYVMCLRGAASTRSSEVFWGLYWGPRLTAAYEVY